MHTHRPKAESKAQDQLEAEFWKRVHRSRWLFQLCPHLSWVGVCNSLPMHKLKNGSDIDLFIVAKKGRLFTCRLWVTFLTQILGVRRHGTKTHKRFCLSFFVEEGYESLADIAIEDDIYLAQWTQTLQPIAGDFHGYERFLEKNYKWTQELVGDLIPQKENFKARSQLQQLIQSTLSLFSFPFEAALRGFQLKRAKKKRANLSDTSGTIITKHRLKFHDKDRRFEIREEWRRSTIDHV